MFCSKNCLKNAKYSTNETILKTGHRARPIAFWKSSLWVQNSNSKIQVKIYSTSDLHLLCAKNYLKKHSKFQWLDDFKNWPSRKAYEPLQSRHFSFSICFPELTIFTYDSTWLARCGKSLNSLEGYRVSSWRLVEKFHISAFPFIIRYIIVLESMKVQN